MDIDPPTLPPSSPKCPAASPLSSSTEKRTKLLLPPTQQTAFNDQMKKISHEQAWQYHMQSTKNDQSQLRALLQDILRYRTQELVVLPQF